MLLDAHARRAAQTLLGERPLVYVDGGARGGKLPRAFRHVRGSRYIGFEADADECARLNAAARPGHRFVAACLGARRETRRFRVTTHAACSSLLAPNHRLLAPLADFAERFHVDRETTVDTIPLDECLAAEGLGDIDVLELDTQGSELDVLAGAERALHDSLLAVQVEVEFAPMYVGQPLFADVDAFLRQLRFRLFDLSRYRVRRTGAPLDVPTRGQLLWGHALYLREPDDLPADRLRRLGVVAALLDLPDFAVDLLERGMGDAGHEMRVATDRIREALCQHTSQGPGAAAVAASTDGTREPRPLERQLAASVGRSVWHD